MQVRRVQPMAVALPNGEVLVAGGFNRNTILAGAEFVLFANG